MNLSILAEPAQTMGYMVAGYMVILGALAIYIISLGVRWRKLTRDQKELKELLKK
jgi:hypothetical protein